MQLPIDITAVFEEMTNLDEARNAELSVSVYIDNSASSDVVSHVRSMFASSASNVHLTLSYLDSSFMPHPGDDMAIIVAGEARSVGAAAAAVRACGVPVAVVTTTPTSVARISREGGHEIPEGDILAPCDMNEEAEPFVLDEKLTEMLDERLGEWIVAVCADKKLVFAMAFPFLRKPLALDAVRLTSLQNAGVGLVPFVPGADLPILTLNQAKMAIQIAASYGQEMGADRLKEMAGVVAGAYLCRTLSRELVEFVPILGFAVRAGVAYGGTSALGHALIEYFEGGKDVTGVANVAAKGTKFVADTVKLLREDPSELVNKVRHAIGTGIPAVREKVGDNVSTTKDVVGEYVPKILEYAEEYGPKVRDTAIEYAEEYGPKVQELAQQYAPKAVSAVTSAVSSRISSAKPTA